ncbi:hypothetical protein JCM11251_000572 [Rhodosporidiobolus azoricus]
MPSPRIRVLGLPGYGQNAAYLDAKLRRAQEIWAEDIELVCMEPPHVLSVPTLPNTGSSSVPSPTSPSHAESSDPATPAGVTQNARYYWQWANHRHFAGGEIETLLAYCRAFLEKHGPFDACLGFSQGSATAVLLLALLERPDLHPIWSAPSSDPSVDWPPAPFKCGVLFSAFGPGDKRYQKWYEQKKPLTPTLHIIGRNDVVANPQHSLDTFERFSTQTRKICWHDGGHHIPRKPYFAHLVKDFILSSIDDARSDLDDERRDGWGSPAESVAGSIGEGTGSHPARPLSPVAAEAKI